MGFARNLLGFLALEALRNALYKFKTYFKTYLRLKWKNFESPLRIDKVKFEFGVQFFWATLYNWLNDCISHSDNSYVNHCIIRRMIEIWIITVRNTVIQSITSKQARTRNTASTVQPKLGIVISLVNNQQHPEVKKAVTNQDSAPPHTTKFSMVYQFTMQPAMAHAWLEWPVAMTDWWVIILQF